MRSNLIYSANKQLSNRFLLCRMTAVAARRMHRERWHFSESINQALTHIATMESFVPAPAPKLPVTDREISLEIPAERDTIEVR
jgi:hypothetical protein